MGLALRGFKTIGLLAVFGVSSERKFARRVCGVYYQMPEMINESFCYQKLLHSSGAKDEVGCDCLYLSWSRQMSRWELTTLLQEVRPVLAHSAVCPKGPLIDAKGPWQVQDGISDFHEDGGFAILVPDASDAGANGAEAPAKRAKETVE